MFTQSLVWWCTDRCGLWLHVSSEAETLPENTEGTIRYAKIPEKEQKKRRIKKNRRSFLLEYWLGRCLWLKEETLIWLLLPLLWKLYFQPFWWIRGLAQCKDSGSAELVRVVSLSELEKYKELSSGLPFTDLVTSVLSKNSGRRPVNILNLFIRKSRFRTSSPKIQVTGSTICLQC